MSIKFAPRVIAKRELICKTDEAVVSRLFTNNRYNGMVERLQKIPGSDLQLFWLHCSDNRKYSIASSQKIYQVMKFQALRLARSLFPDNFVNLHAMHISKRADSFATYSDYVPDDNGVIERQSQRRIKFYNEYTIRL